MATPVIMPKLGNSVESSIIVEWNKAVGDAVEAGEVLCEVETDKAIVAVESPVAGVLLARFFDVGADVPVRTTIAAVGAVDESFDDLRPSRDDRVSRQDAGAPSSGAPSANVRGTDVRVTASNKAVPNEAVPNEAASVPEGSRVRISPRARRLAAEHAVALSTLVGSGPQGRIIERDVDAAIKVQPRLSPVARAMIEEGDYVAPPLGSGPRGRVMSRDLAPKGQESLTREPEIGRPYAEGIQDAMEQIPVRGVRRVIADRMLASLQGSAQLTLTASADARALLGLRWRLKESAEALQLRSVTVNDLLLFAVSRTLPQFPGLNAHFDGETISQFAPIHLGVAVDTERGLLVPVIHNAHQRSLRELAQTSRRLASAAQSGAIKPDEMTGGTFTVTNLGHLGIESFTPILNPPQVAILGVGATQLRPVAIEQDGADPARLLDSNAVQFAPHIGLSLTINHQVVDGAPAARFLQSLAQGLATFDLLMAL